MVLLLTKWSHSWSQLARLQLLCLLSETTTQRQPIYILLQVVALGTIIPISKSFGDFEDDLRVEI